MRVGAGARSCHAPSAGPTMQQDFLGRPARRRRAGGVRRLCGPWRFCPAETVTEIPKVLLRFTTQIPMFMTSLQSR